VLHADRQRTEIVDAGNFHHAVFDRIQDTLQEADSCVVSQLGILKAQ
jgi:hypothetical protein